MEDSRIIELYWARDEAAIAETKTKYGALCRRIAGSILDLPEDCEECVSDCYLAAWEGIPPARPGSLAAFLGRIARNIAISRFRANRASKRYNGMETLLSELEDCIPARGGPEEALEARLLGQAISRWLDSLPREDRLLFLGRYWYGEPLQDLAAARGLSPTRLAQRMLKLRRSLRAALEKGGIL